MDYMIVNTTPPNPQMNNARFVKSVHSEFETEDEMNTAFKELSDKTDMVRCSRLKTNTWNMILDENN